MREDLGEGSARRVKINESTTLSPSPSPSERVASAFTLAETLITLVIVGVVAALTVPTLITKYQEQQTVTAVKKFYSEISQAYNSAIAKNGPPETWDWVDNSAGSEHIMDILAPHLRILNRCGAGGENDKCFGNTIYKTLNKSINWGTNPNTEPHYSAARLDNGFIFWLRSLSNACNNSYGSNKLTKVCGEVGIDINGYKKPNALGRDTYYFWITKYGIIPMGTKYDNWATLPLHCKVQSTNSNNGFACTAWIIEKGNMDYLHRDVSW